MLWVSTATPKVSVRLPVPQFPPVKHLSCGSAVKFKGRELFDAADGEPSRKPVLYLDVVLPHRDKYFIPPSSLSD